MKLRISILFLVAACALLTPAMAGQPIKVTLPADLQGDLGGVPYRILVPQNWNGTLLVYAHGYGESESVTPPLLAPLPADQNTLFAQGFALAASRFDGSGWTVKEGMQSTVALTAAFNGMVARPQQTIIWGKSMGGLMALGLAEKFPGHYDGAVALCPPAAGTPRRFDQTLDITLAYAVGFGWKPEWGTPGDLRDDLNFTTEVLIPILIPQMTNQANKGLWEFVRLVNRIPVASFYTVNGLGPVMYMSFAGRVELENRAGGAIAENVGRTYTLTDQEKGYLVGLGVDVNSLLQQMNSATEFTSDHNARNYVEHYFDPSGRIKVPILTLHTIGDPLAIPNNESAYRETVEEQGNADLLMQQFTDGKGHCTFTTQQDIAGINAMVHWLETGTRPDPSDFFLETLGFKPNYFPGPWPW
jgi:pimeloyl-ACP methyl ester carboxylesterase